STPRAGGPSQEHKGLGAGPGSPDSPRSAHGHTVPPHDRPRTSSDLRRRGHRGLVHPRPTPPPSADHQGFRAGTRHIGAPSRTRMSMPPSGSYAPAPRSKPGTSRVQTPLTPSRPSLRLVPVVESRIARSHVGISRTPY